MLPLAISSCNDSDHRSSSLEYGTPQEQMSLQYGYMQLVGGAFTLIAIALQFKTISSAAEEVQVIFLRSHAVS